MMLLLSPLLVEGAAFGALNVLGMFILEFGLSSHDVELLRKREGGKELHLAGLLATTFNSIILGSITYAVIMKYCCVDGPLTLLQQARSIIMFLIIENFWYYLAHMAMHTRQLYWMHRFHHKFNVVVLPSSASAVSIPEFLIAYMAPFVVGSYVAGTDKTSSILAAVIVMTSNFIIHTPALEEVMSHLPWMFVTPSDHFAHHRQLTLNYGAPLISVDRIVNMMKEYLAFYYSSLSSDKLEEDGVVESVPSDTSLDDGEDSDDSEEADENTESKKKL